jgi:hypothetical protein
MANDTILPEDRLKSVCFIVGKLEGFGSGVVNAGFVDIACQTAALSGK